MKIYAVRDRVRNNEAFFDTLIGKDLWVKVTFNRGYQAPADWVRILSKRNTASGAARYEVNWVGGELVTPDGTYPCSPATKAKTLDDTFTINLGVIPVEPVELKTTDEFFRVLNY